MVTQVKVQPRKGARTKRGSPPRRAPWGTMSRAQVVDAAMDVVSGGGYEQMTIRSLASRLGVAPMSLYRHVKDKGDLLDEVVDRLFDEIWRPAAPPEDWRAWMTEAAERAHRFLVEQPAALHVYLRHPVTSPAAAERTEEVVRVLAQATGDEAAARRAHAAIHTYTLGFSALEAARAKSPLREGDGGPLARQLASYATPRQFLAGLNFLLDGIERGSAGAGSAA